MSEPLSERPSPEEVKGETVTLQTQRGGEDLPKTFVNVKGETMTAPPAGSELLPGYVLEECLGKGGMGVVYRARQTKLNRPVALKMILHAEHASEVDRRRFQREAEVLAKLRHPNIVQVFEVGEHAGQPYF